MHPDEYPNQREDELPDKELEIVEVEPNKETVDKMVPLVDLEAIARDEMDKLLNPPIAEA
jgi:hypothetical protein